MRLASILLVSALLTCGNFLSIEGKQGYTVKTTDGKRLLRSDEERGFNWPWHKLDEVSAIKQLANDFADLKAMNEKAADVFRLMRDGGMSDKKASSIANLFAKYIQDPSRYH